MCRLSAIVFLACIAMVSGCATPSSPRESDRRSVAGPLPAPASQATVPGLRFALATGDEVFVPEGLSPGATEFDLVVHFHGAPEVVEREFTAAGLRAVLVTVNYHGLSGVYEKPFSDPQRFRALLDDTLAELKTRRRVAESAQRRRLCVSSFSAGFGAVRALLKAPEHFASIDGLYLADTVYAGYVEQDGQRRVNPDNMTDFRRFAAEAVAGRKTMIITHSYLEPGTYAGTHETADDLIAFVEAQRRAVDEAGPGGMRIISRVDQGYFFVRGCAGTTGEDHMAHLRNMRFGYGLLPVERVQTHAASGSS